MVAIDALNVLDSAGIKSELFSIPGKRTAPMESETLNLEGEEGASIAASAFLAGSSEPVILYFPAEFDSDETIALLGQGIRDECGFSLIAMEYREFGLSIGEFSFADCLYDADLFVSSILKWKEEHENDGPIVMMGRSFGSVLALDQALKHQDSILCLVLESAFSSTKVFLERSGIDPRLIPQGEIFGNRAKMSRLKRPVLFVHSPRDEIQGLSEVEWLVAESRSKATQFQIAPSGTRRELAHQVGVLYLAFLKQYINLRRGIRPSRKKNRHRRVQQVPVN